MPPQGPRRQLRQPDEAVLELDAFKLSGVGDVELVAQNLRTGVAVRVAHRVRW